MNEYTAIPYRTPACDEHLPDNACDECPWCKIDEMKRELADLNHEYDKSVAHSAILLANAKAKIVELEAASQHWKNQWDAACDDIATLKEDMAAKEKRIKELQKAEAKIDELEAKVERVFAAGMSGIDRVCEANYDHRIKQVGQANYDHRIRIATDKLRAALQEDY